MQSNLLEFVIVVYCLGFEYSAHTFEAESLISQSKTNGMAVPKGALITMLQKGLLYAEAEIFFSKDGEFILKHSLA